MYSIFDYVKYYGNKTFNEVKINEIDALIFSCLAYLNFDVINKKLPMTINDFAIEYFARVTPNDLKNQVNIGRLYKDCYNLFNDIKNKPRYKNIIINNYQKYVDVNCQFGAITFKCKHFKFIAFEGTNTYISGWKEDLNLSHQFPVKSQMLAKKYIESNISLFDKNIYIGGHSKGGNLAVVGSMLTGNSYKNKIINIFDFDGPGLRKEEFESNEFNLVNNKIKKYVPSESMVGMLMHNPKIYKVIKSDSKIILQHNPFSWKCYGSYFIEDKLSKRSLEFSKDIINLLNEYPSESLEEFVEVIFKVFEENNIKKTTGISLQQIASLTKYIKNINADMKIKEKISKLFYVIINYINN